MKKSEYSLIIVTFSIIGGSLDTFRDIIFKFLEKYNWYGHNMFFTYIVDLVVTIRTPLVLSVLSWLYFNKLWRSFIPQLFLPKADLNGSWLGSYSVTYIKDGNEEVAEGEIALSINQNYFEIGVESFAKRNDYSSITEKLIFDEKNKVYNFYYTYQEIDIKEEKYRRGMTELKVIDDQKEKKLSGNFWTSNNSIGTLDFTKVSNKCFRSLDSILREANKVKSEERGEEI